MQTLSVTYSRVHLAQDLKLNEVPLLKLVSSLSVTKILWLIKLGLVRKCFQNAVRTDWQVLETCNSRGRHQDAPKLLILHKSGRPDIWIRVTTMRM